MARPKILVFQHVPFEPLGTLDPLLKKAGFRIRYVNFGRTAGQWPTLDVYVALIVLGGPMNADDVINYPNLAAEVGLIQDALERDIAILGICLGAQLLAKAPDGPSPDSLLQFSCSAPQLILGIDTDTRPLRRDAHNDRHAERQSA